MFEMDHDGLAAVQNTPVLERWNGGCHPRNELPLLVQLALDAGVVRGPNLSLEAAASEVERTIGAGTSVSELDRPWQVGLTLKLPAPRCHGAFFPSPG